jgi:hypothetical protein
VDDSVISGHHIQRNGLGGIVIADYCLATAGTPFDCALDPTVTAEYVADSTATSNVVANNVLVDNGTNPLGSPFDFAASDLILLTLEDWGNCFADNSFTTYFSSLGILPPCSP